MATIKALFLRADAERAKGDHAECERMMFAAGMMWGQWCVDEERWRGVHAEWNLAKPREANHEAKLSRQQDAVAELHRRWKSNGRLSRDAIAKSMAGERTADGQTKWGALRTLRRYFSGIERPTAE